MIDPKTVSAYARPTATPWSPPARPDPITDWTPEMGHIKGASYEWNYARDNMQLAPKPSWEGRNTLPFPEFATGNTSTYASPGFPVNIRPDTLIESQKDFWTQGPGAVALGVTPGEQQGGAIPGPFGIPIANLPLTMDNAPMYFAEAPLALITSALGGAYRERPDGTVPAEEADIPIISNIIDGIGSVGKIAQDALAMLDSTNKRAQATERIRGYATVIATGQADQTVLATVGDILGVDRGSLEAIKVEANKRGVDWRDLLRQAWDLPKSVTDQVDPDPRKYMSATPGIYTAGVADLATMPFSPAWELANGVEYSLDPGSNTLATMGNVGLVMAGTYVIGGAALGFARGATGALTQGTRAASALAPSANVAGRIGGYAAKAFTINNAAGLGIRATEWAIKQYAVMAGDVALTEHMDRLLLERPLSWNPGLNLLGSLASHPIATAKSLRRGRIPIGAKGSAGAIGEINVRRLGVTSFDDPNVYLTIAGRPVTIIPTVREAIGKLRDMDIDQLHENFLKTLGWTRADVEAYWGEGNKTGLTVDDLRTGIFYGYLQRAREMSTSARDLVPGATMVERSHNFFIRHANDVVALMRSDLRARRSTSSARSRTSSGPTRVPARTPRSRP